MTFKMKRGISSTTCTYLFIYYQRQSRILNDNLAGKITQIPFSDVTKLNKKAHLIMLQIYVSFWLILERALENILMN